jgi:ubiquinone/menaquinone biosynthesis C-methylase UbiE
MQHSRYAYAAGFCDGKDVLEVACGAGQGLGYLAKRARRVVGGDFTQPLLKLAGRHYQSSVPLVCLDAHTLPFSAATFDVVILFEAIYYLREADRVLRECKRVLKCGGVLLVCSSNKKWPGFMPSPFATRYFDAVELRNLLTGAGFETQVFGAFPAVASTIGTKTVSLIRHLGTKLNLIPGSLKGRELLKRLFYGPLAVVGPEIDERMAKPPQFCAIDEGQPSLQFRVLYAAGRIESVQT